MIKKLALAAIGLPALGVALVLIVAKGFALAIAIGTPPGFLATEMNGEGGNDGAGITVAA